MQQDSSIPGNPPDATDEVVSEVVLPQPEKKPSAARSIFSTVAIFVAAPLLAFALIAFAFQSYVVDGPSMENTLQNNDRVIVWKVPKTIARVTGHNYIPHRDDVIIFVKRGLAEPNSSKDKQLIKRVIGLPGERVVVSNGKITIYNNEHPEGFNPDLNHDFSANIASVTTGNIDLVVPPGQVFVCGDNRVNSLDSRIFGPIPTSDIVGKLALRIFPANTFKSFIGSAVHSSVVVQYLSDNSK